CHLGVLLDRPSVGVAKSRLIGTHSEPSLKASSWTPLFDRLTSGQGSRETIGAVLRTRDAVKPIYVSIGHRVSLERAIELVRVVSHGHRITGATRDAVNLIEAVKRVKQL